MSCKTCPLEGDWGFPEIVISGISREEARIARRVLVEALRSAKGSGWELALARKLEQAATCAIIIAQGE